MNANAKKIMNEKPFLVCDNYYKDVIFATTARKACEDFQKQRYCKSAPKLSKTFVYGIDGEVYHTGYVCGSSWMMVGEVDFMRVKQ